jgi:hypothetical protein
LKNLVVVGDAVNVEALASASIASAQVRMEPSIRIKRSAGIVAALVRALPVVKAKLSRSACPIPEAKQQRRAFSESVRLPAPEDLVQMVIKTRGPSNEVREVWSILVDPSDARVERGAPLKLNVWVVRQNGAPRDKVDAEGTDRSGRFRARSVSFPNGSKRSRHGSGIYLAS